MGERNPDRRTKTACAYCATEFLRDRNTRYCSDACRFMSKVEVGPHCWTWQATLDRHGYGTFYFAGRNQSAHRVAHEMFRDPIPDGLHIDHLCRNRACVNPAHLDAVEQRINTLRGDAPTAAAWREGRCKNGHPRTPENTYVRNERARQCRVCMAISRAKREGRAA
jgi:hypothetical protein